jgi:ATP-dependent Clp protease ATP-binding subunit ClpA
LIQTEIKDILSDEILFGRLNKGGNVFIDVENEKLTFNYNAKTSLSEPVRESETLE